MSRGGEVDTGNKLKVLQIDLGGCEGCAISILRAIPLVKDLVELVSQYLVDEEFNIDGEFDVAFVTGPLCVNDEEKIEKIKMIRKNTRILVAFGSCAAFACITRFCRGGQEPKPQHKIYQPINHVVDVDYSIPGCPPPPQFVRSFITALQRNAEAQLRLFRAIAKVRKLDGFDLLDDVVLPDLCVGCGACELSCPTGAIKLVSKRPDLIVEKCIRCGTCYIRCPRGSQMLIGALG